MDCKVVRTDLFEINVGDEFILINQRAPVEGGFFSSVDSALKEHFGDLKLSDYRVVARTLNGDFSIMIFDDNSEFIGFNTRQEDVFNILMESGKRLFSSIKSQLDIEKGTH